MNRRVLICDPTPLTRQLAVESLREAGWEIVGEATDGQTALALFEQHRPDTVLIDVALPNHDGLSTLEAMLQIDPAASVVIASELQHSRRIGDALRRGARDFVAKPFMPSQLQRIMAGRNGSQ